MKITTKHNVFVYYNGVLKIFEPYLLDTVRDPFFQDKFSTVLDYSKFLNLDFKNLIRLCVQRIDTNIFKYVAFDEFKETYDFDKLYKTIYDATEDLMLNSPELDFTHHLQFLASRQFIENIYIYSDNFDSRIQEDINMTFISNKNKFQYIYGDINEAVKKYKSDLYVFPDIDLIQVLKSNGILPKKEIMLAQYGFNFKLNSNEDILELKENYDKYINNAIFKLQMFKPIQMDESFFTQIETTFG